jgi:hypothetical protein
VTWALYLGGFLMFAAILWSIFTQLEREWTGDYIEEFVQRFPGQCPICAFDRHAAQNGVMMGKFAGKPRDHLCPEAAREKYGARETWG